MPRYTRRKTLKTAGITISGLALAGCTSEEDGGGGDGGDGGDGGTEDGGGTPVGDGNGDGETPDEMSIALASGYPYDDPNYPTGTAQFEQRVQEKSDGRITVNVFPDSQQGSDQEIAQKVQTGSLEMAHTCINNLAPFVQEVNAKNLPLLVRGKAESDRLLASDTWGEWIYPKYRENLFEPLMEHGFDFRHLSINPGVADEAVQVPSDMEGIDIRVAGSEIVAELFETIGANTVNVAWAETPSAMREGVFDAVHISRLATDSFGFAEFVEYTSNPNVANTMLTTFCNLEWYEGLDQTHRDIIDEAAAEQRQDTVELVDEALQGAVERIEEAGSTFVEISEEDRQLWVDEVGYSREMWDPFIEEWGINRDRVDQLREAATE